MILCRSQPNSKDGRNHVRRMRTKRSGNQCVQKHILVRRGEPLDAFDWLSNIRSDRYLMVLSASQSISQSASPSVSRSVKHTGSQSVMLSVSHSISLSDIQSVCELVSQLVSN